MNRVPVEAVANTNDAADRTDGTNKPNWRDVKKGRQQQEKDQPMSDARKLVLSCLKGEMMKVVYCVLELGAGGMPSVCSIAKLSGLAEQDVTIKCLAACTAGNHKRFERVADLYLWTCKFWYGTYRDKLTFVELRGLEELPSLFQLKYSKELRLAIYSRKLSIFDANGMAALERASFVSMEYFNEERIAKLSEVIGEVEPYYDLLYVSNNPFAAEN